MVRWRWCNAGLLKCASVMMCPHGGTVQAITGNARVSAAGGFLLRASDTFLVVGCPFIVGGPQSAACRCSGVHRPAQPGARRFTLTEASVGLCCAADQAVQGTGDDCSTQPRVSGV